MYHHYFKKAGLLFLLALVWNISGASAQSVLDIINDNPNTSAIAAAVEETGLTSELSNAGPYTLFVPSNNAFNKLSKNERTNSDLLLNHIITGTATKRSLKFMSQITSLSGITIEIVKENNNRLSVQNCPLVESNIRADNGVVHIIGGVIK